METTTPISRLVLLHETNGQDVVLPFAAIRLIEDAGGIYSRVFYSRGADEHVIRVEGAVSQVRRWLNDQLFELD